MKTLFCDLGGCFLTNGWDHVARRRACETFGIEFAAVEPLHQREVDGFEKGETPLDEYLSRTYLAVPARAPVALSAFVAFMKSCSGKLGSSLDVLEDFRRKFRGRCFAFNNESRELNEYRIETFGLGGRFDAFLSSCYLGLRKPGAAIYLRALEIAAVLPGDVLFIDDRPENIAAGAATGMQTYPFESSEGLARRLEEWA